MKTQFKQLLLAVISGASLTLSFAPFSFWFLVYFSLISLIFLYYYSCLDKSVLYSGILGFCWGLGFFGTHVSWVFVSIYKYGGTNFLLAGLITLIFIGFLAIFPAINLIILRKLKLIDPINWRFNLGFAASWVLIEIFRGWFLTGFPWGFLGYTQLNCSLKYYASYFGVFGVSFLVALIAGIFTRIIFIIKLNFKQLNLYKFWPNILLIIGIYGVSYQLNHWDLNRDIISLEYANKLLKHNKFRSPKVAIIQGNIAPNDKFLTSSVDNLMYRIREIYWQLSLNLIKELEDQSNNLEELDLVIWPENSLPLEYGYPEVKEFLQQLDQLAKHYNFGLLLGMPVAANYLDFYNSVLGLGKARGSYYKINLVPFGDYVPFSRWLRGLIKFLDLPLSNFISGREQQSPILLTRGKLTHRILATICYDIAYAAKLRERVIYEQPEVIIALSEDGWFGDSLGPHQHLDLARMRALETGRYVLRATTSGISAVIDNRGNIVNKAPMFKPFTLISSYEYCCKQTFWNKIGNLPVILFLLGCLIWVGREVIKEKLFSGKF